MSKSSYIRKKNQPDAPKAHPASVEKVKDGKKPAPGKNVPPPVKKIIPPYNTKKANRYFVLFFFACSVILYGNTILNKFAVDDSFVTGPQNELVSQGFHAIPKIFTSFYVEKKGNVGNQQSDYRPIVKLTYAIESGLWGNNKAGRSHAINMLIYFWLITLLFFILRRLLKDYNILFPFLITVLFMAHPVHTEAVASLKNRDELLAFLCGLGTLHYFLRYTEHRKPWYIVAALGIFFVGYLCKSSIIPFVFLIPLVLYFFTDLKPKSFIWIFLAILAIIAVAYLGPRIFLPKAIPFKAFIENPLNLEKSFWLKTGTGFITLLFYQRILVFPHPLLYYYGYDMIPVTGWGNIWVLVSFVIQLGLFIIALRKFREKHILSFAILWFFLAISMYSNVAAPVVGIVGERFVFNASLGFCIAVVYLLFRIFRTDPRSLTIEFNERAKIVVILFLILIPFTAMTISRNRAWRNLRDLYTVDIKYLDNSVKANIEYANYLVGTIYRDPNYLQNGAVNEKKQQVIVGHFRKALKLYPDDYSTLNDLAAAYLNFSTKYDSGVFFLKKAIALRPELQSAWVNMAMAYRKKNNLDSAIACYEKVLKINPTSMTAWFKMADLYFEKGDAARAIRMNEDVMKKHPELDVPYFNIGYYFVMHGDTITAIKYWEQAAQRNPGYEVCMNLAMMYKGKGNKEKADYYYGLAQEAQRQRNQMR
ncbi:MAG: tetratricopeptide repeat protein [Bacteroidetes bacterium]|nr:tetratricopeptide repeat protein [Bacteroidota bacterium]